MLIGVDNCDDGPVIETAYNDPQVRLASHSIIRRIADRIFEQGVTRDFILTGVDHAGRVLHGDLAGDGGLRADNFEYVSRYNDAIGRHEVRNFGLIRPDEES